MKQLPLKEASSLQISKRFLVLKWSDRAADEVEVKATEKSTAKLQMVSLKTIFILFPLELLLAVYHDMAVIHKFYGDKLAD